MGYLDRRRMIVGGVLSVVALPTVAERASSAYQGSDDETPAEGCLTLETFPVIPGDRPHDVAPAADGQRIWYTAQGAGNLGLFDPVAGEIVTVPLGDQAAPHGVIVAADGGAWVTDSGLNAMVRVDPETLDLAVYPISGPNVNLNTAAIDSQGVVWFTGQAGIVGRIDPERHEPGDPPEVIEAPRGRGPYGITVTPADEVYFASLAGHYLGRIEPDGERFRVVELDPPTPEQGTRRAWSDSRGIIWTSQWTAGQVARYDPVTESWQEWRLPGENPQAYAVYVDERDDVWLSDFGSNALVRFDPDTETFASVPLPDPGSNIRQIHGRPGEVWGPASGADKLVVVRCQDGN